MKSHILILFFVIGFVKIQAQQPTKFDDLVEVIDNGSIKLYLDAVFKIVYKDCSDYYMIANFDNKYFQIQDTLKIYYKSDKLFFKGKYENGERQGKFIWYYKNGQIQTIGSYTLGKRSGIWEYYYSNGNLHKKIEYKNNKEYLIDLLEKNGKILVKNGNGFFKDDVLLSIANISPSSIKGEVLNGLPNSKWQISTSGTKIGTEYFENNSFIKGISHSIAFGDEEYQDKYISTFTGIIYIEHLRLFGPSICRSKSSLGLTQVFFNNLKQKYNSSDLKNIISNNWFLVEIKADGSKNIINVEIYSNAKQDISNQLKKIVFEMGKVNTIMSNSRSEYQFFPLVIYNNDIYLPPDEKIELLKHYY